MAGSETCVAVVPARGGSRGIPGKNLVDVGGRPLIAWTIEAALEASTVDRVLVSTDDPRIAEVAVAEGAEVPFLRDRALAEDHVHASRVVLDALAWLDDDGACPDIVAMMLPTSPLRDAGHVDGALSLLHGSGAPAVVSVYRWHRYLTNLRYVRGGSLEPVAPASTYNVQRQDAEPLFAVNGAIFAARVDAFREHRSFHVPGAIPYLMSEAASVDVNEPDDLERARQALLAAGSLADRP